MSMSEEVFGYGVFQEQFENRNAYEFCEFEDSSINLGSVLSSAIFKNNSVNRGGLSGVGIFCNNSKNESIIQTDISIFVDNAVNEGTVNYGIFLGSSVNLGNVLSAAVFAGNSINNGNLSCDVTFTEYSQNSADGKVEKTAYISTTVQNTGVFNLTSLYVQPSGFFPYGHFQQVKTPPENYKSTAWNLSGVWFTYNESGTGELANEIYNIGTDITGCFNFHKGVKKILLEDYVKNGLFSTGVYDNDQLIETTNNFPEKAKDTYLYYNVINGLTYLANESYSNGVYNNGVKVLYTTSLEDPKKARDDSNYYVYNEGVPSLADKVYGTEFYFENGLINTEFNNNEPQLNVINKWVIVENGLIRYLEGPQPTGYYYSGVLSGTYITPTFIEKINKWLVYNNGYPLSASGTYSNGRFLDGDKLPSTSLIPESAIDDPTSFYVYSSGEALIANGPFTVGYFVDGQQAGTVEEIQQTINDPLIYCSYLNGTPLSAQGAYKSGYYINGRIDPTYTTTIKQSAIDDIFSYRYTKGLPSYSYTRYWNPTISEISIPSSERDWFNIYNWYADVSATDDSNKYEMGEAVVYVLSSTIAPQIYIDDVRWSLYPADNIYSIGSNLVIYSDANGSFTSNITGTVVTCRGNVILE